jgi:putative transposase
MARQARFDVAGVPQHVVQRCVDSQPCFVDTADYLHYRQELAMPRASTGARYTTMS